VRAPSAALVLVGLLLSTGCRKSGIDLELDAARRFEAKDPTAGQFRRVFPSSVGYFAYFNPEAGTGVWTSKVGLRGRYVLIYKTTVTIDNSGRCTATGRPEFHLLQADSVAREPDGTVRCKYRPQAQIDFGADRWGILVLQGGALESLDASLGKEPPLPDFDLCWKGF
jgi:hypothetical protein